MAYCFNRLSSFLLLCLVIKIIGLEIPFKIVNNDFTNDDNDTNNGNNNHSFPIMRQLKQDTCRLERRNRLYFIKVSIGSPRKEYVLKLSTLFQGISLIDIKKNRKGYNSTLSNTFTSIKENHTNFLGWGVISSETLFFEAPDISIEKVPFFLVKKTHYATTLYSGVFGLAYDTEDSTEDNDKSAFDFIDYLPSLKQQYSPIIGLKALNASEGLMSIGELPTEIQLNPKLYHKCPLLSIKTKHSWSCKLNAIYFQDQFLYQINAKIDFTLGGSTMSVPKYLYELMIERYFKKEFETETCRFNDEDEIYTRFMGVMCNKEYNTSSVGVISFVFGKWTLKIPSEKLFYYSRESHYFSIVYDKNGDENLFMSPILLSDFYFFFDKGNKQLGFYNLYQGNK